MIYVSPLEQLFNKSDSVCLMVSDDQSEDGIAALHQFAEKSGIGRSWFYLRMLDAPFPHYNILSSMRARAIAYGAKPISYRRMMNLCVKEHNNG